MRTSPLLLVFDLAGLEARSASSPSIDTAHLMVGLAKVCDLKLADTYPPSLPQPLKDEFAHQQAELVKIFERAGVDPRLFRRRLRFQIHQRGGRGTSEEIAPDDGVLHRTQSAKRAFERTRELETDPESAPRLIHLLRALAESPDAFWFDVWREFNREGTLLELFEAEVFPRVDAERVPANEAKSALPRPAARTLSITPTLDRFGRDLSALARENLLTPVWGRDTEMVRLARILASARKGNALLIGAAGVGKTAIVEGLACRLAAHQVPPGLENLRLIEVPLTGLLAGAAYRGEWEERLNSLLKEAEQPGIVLFFDEIHTLVGAGGQGASDAAQIVKPALARGAVRIIGATTPEEYARTIERDTALTRRFEPLWVEEPSPEMTLEILRQARAHLEAHHGVVFEDEALSAAIELSVRLLPALQLPDKALDALDAAATMTRLQTLSFSPGETQIAHIGHSEVAHAIAQRARVPVEQVRHSNTARLRLLETALKRRVVGQDDNITRVVDALKLSFSGFAPTNQPRGVFLFAGASGSGKTELAKALAQALYDDEGALVRFDMGEYREPHTVARLLGAPPGYVGHDQEGQLSARLRARPASIMLFDEIEKAHPDIWNLFLPLFDEGYLTDARGRRLDFSETVVILTSNLGTGHATPRALGLRAHEAGKHDVRALFEAQVQNAIRETLRPELLGRIGEVLVFAPLDLAARQQVAELLLLEVATRAEARGITFTWKPEVVEQLAQQGYDPQTGARPLRRLIERRVALPLAEAMLAAIFEAGDCVEAESVEGELKFKKRDFAP